MQSVPPPEFWVVVFAMLGAILGSYINMAAYRLPRGISTVTRTRSFCPSCEHQLYWYDNIPLLSFITLFGRCRYCRKPIGLRYLLTEVLVTALFVLAAYQFFVLNPPLTWMPFTGNMPRVLFAVQLFLIVDLVLLSIVDLETWLIPFETTLPWIAAGLVLAPIFPELHLSASAWTGNPRVNAFIDSFQGLVFGLGLPWMINMLTMMITFTKDRLKGIRARPREGMGMGDAHLLGMIGALLGWKPALATLFIGVFVGCFTGISKILWDRFQQWRLGDKWKPWQPTYELPPESAPMPPAFWPLAVMGAVVLIACGFLGEQAQRFPQTTPGLPQLFAQLDTRMFAVYAMIGIGLLLVVGSGFLKYLSIAGLLPQGEIEESDEGEKKEVLQGNYIPFGPSLAIAALIVVFYDPLIRNLAWWFALGGSGMPARPAFDVIGQEGLTSAFISFVQWWQNLFQI